MYIVGTSGHIDHGKTSLIKALTGTDCDRLPEEKEREMTIDIGFAQLEYSKFGTVSVIDVPGHERFIRNMVAGAWGIDLALLVIAVDDSWMPQTEDHFRVIELLGIQRMIVVLTKIDIADQEIIEIVEEDIKERLSNTKFADCDFIKVSSKTGAGIDDLKNSIRKNLEKLTKAANTWKPYLFVDRVFESKGHGTIVTGTLKNGAFNENDEVAILPGSIKARIKKIESHHHAINEGAPSQRTALNLHGVSVDDLKRGNIIVKQNFFTESDDVIASIKLLEINKEIKNNLGIEILIGTSAIKGKLILLNNAEEKQEPAKELTVRIKFDSQWAFYTGELFIITNPGGYRIIGGGRIILPDFKAITEKKSLRSSLQMLKQFTPKEIIEFYVKIKPAIAKEEIKTRLPDSNKDIDKAIADLLKADLIVQKGDFISDRIYYNDSKNKIADIINKNTGLNIKEISDIAGVGQDIVRFILPELLNENMILEKDGKYFSGDLVTPDTLPEDKKKILQQLKAMAADGMELEKAGNDSAKKSLKDLIRLGFAVSLDGNIIYHFEIYNDLKNKVMALFNGRERITIAEAREPTGLSRKYLIPLLNRIEDDGLIKRLGDFRVKV
jgi:selenocysteine-specific elongation factor